MRIVSGICSFKEAAPLIKAGARDFYAGYISESMSPSIGSLGLNRRYSQVDNFTSLDELEKTRDYLALRDINLAIAINTFYNDKNLEESLALVDNLMGRGLNTFILADFGLIHSLVKRYDFAINLYASTMMVLGSVQAISVIKGLGFKKIILPRHLSLMEINELTRDRDLDYEVFIYGQRCFFEDGHCGWQHGQGQTYQDQRGRDLFNKLMPPGLSARIRAKFAENHKASGLGCARISCPDSAKLINYNSCGNKAKKLDSVTGDHKFILSCGICSLFYLRDGGVNYLKLPNRTEPLKIKVNQVKFVKKALMGLEMFKNYHEYSGYCRKLFKTFFGFSCGGKYCYYE